MKSRILNLSLIAIAAAVLTACGGGGGGDDKSSTPAEKPATPPASDEARYGYVGEVLEPGSVFEDAQKNAPEGATVTPVDYLTFAVTANDAWPSSQPLTVAKIEKSPLVGFDFGDFSFATEDNWTTAPEVSNDSKVTHLKQFNGGDAVVACFGKGSDKTYVAISDKATVVTNLAELYNTSMIEYTCGAEAGVSNPLEDGEIETIDAKGNIGDYGINISQFASKDGIKEEGYQAYATAYKLNGKYYILIKDWDTERNTNASPYGVSLMVIQ